MSELSFTVAQSLAASLTTMGHPYGQAAINATAVDLMTWCKGVFFDGRFLNPEQQAQKLVNHVRMNWDAWPEQGGTKLLRAEFLRLFTPPKDPDEDRKRWEREYGPPDKNWSEKFIAKAVAGTDKKADFERQKRQMVLESIKDAIYYTEGQGRFDHEEEHGDHKERRREKRQNEAFWRDAMQHDNEKHADTVAEVRQQVPEL